MNMNKHLMTDPEGNSEFCFSKTLNVPPAKPRETLRSRGNEIHCFAWNQSFKCFVIPHNSKLEKTAAKI